MRVISRLPDPPMTFFTLETTENSRSVHVLDPDGNEIELYVDISGDRPVGTS
jgi:catechol-2,3-dioxygenase